MEKKTDYIHRNKSGCDCAICNNQIREERQYGALEVVSGKFRILDAEEVAHFRRWNNTTPYPKYEKIEPDEQDNCILAYGVLIPQYDCTDEEKNKIFSNMEKYKNYAFGTLMDNKVYISAYEDYVLYKDKIVYAEHVPCALLINSSLDLSKEQEYGFGHTLFLLYKDMEILDVILNRDFLFCLGEIEESYNPEYAENWKSYIKQDKLMEIANRLF